MVRCVFLCLAFAWPALGLAHDAGRSPGGGKAAPGVVAPATTADDDGSDAGAGADDGRRPTELGSGDVRIGLPQEEPGEAVPGAGDILVRFEDDRSARDIDAIVERVGGTIVSRMLGGMLVQLEVPGTTTQETLLEAYAATEGVRYAEPVQPVSIDPVEPSPQAPDGTGTD